VHQLHPREGRERNQREEEAGRPEERQERREGPLEESSPGHQAHDEARKLLTPMGLCTCSS